MGVKNLSIVASGAYQIGLLQNGNMIFYRSGGKIKGINDFLQRNLLLEY